MACAQKNPQLLAESKTVRGRERTTYWCMLAILYFPFSILSSFFLSFFSLPFLSQCLLVCCDSLLEVAITVFVIVILPLPAVHGKGPLNNACCDQSLLFQLLTTFVWSGCPCQPLIGLPVTQPPPLTCAGRATRQRRLFCLFAGRDTLIYYSVGALSLSLLVPHGMHLVVPAHPCFLWVVCHLNRIFHPKEPEQEPQNRFSPLPTARPCPLTSDP